VTRPTPTGAGMDAWTYACVGRSQTDHAGSLPANGEVMLSARVATFATSAHPRGSEPRREFTMCKVCSRMRYPDGFSAV
jgi:hypothetical protein